MISYQLLCPLFIRPLSLLSIGLAYSLGTEWHMWVGFWWLRLRVFTLRHRLLFNYWTLRSGGMVFLHHLRWGQYDSILHQRHENEHLVFWQWELTWFDFVCWQVEHLPWQINWSLFQLQPIIYSLVHEWSQFFQLQDKYQNQRWFYSWFQKLQFSFRMQKTLASHLT